MRIMNDYCSSYQIITTNCLQGREKNGEIIIELLEAYEAKVDGKYVQHRVTIIPPLQSL